MTTAVLTDRYELTMLDAALRSGAAERPCVFEAFARELPAGRRFGVIAGLGRLIDAIERFRFDDATLAWLDDHDVVGPDTLRWLAGYRFQGELYAYPEGELYVPGTPVLTVSASFGEGVVLETLVLSILNHDSAIASAAARIVQAADGRGLMEFGSRRAHEESAVAAARAAYLVGFDGTSNVAAGTRHGVPTLGTTAHAFVLLHDDERAAVEAQIDATGPGTTVLVDTYDTPRGIDLALELAGSGLGAIRIDSGDLGAEAAAARQQLDTAGATGTRIVVSGDLDEHRIAALADAPIDAYGVGTRLVTGSGAPTAGLVYKLVARARDTGQACEPVAKAGGVKATIGGRKAASRRLRAGTATAEVLRPWGTAPRDAERALQVPVLVGGELHHDPDLDTIRTHHRAAMDELPSEARRLDAGEPAWTIEEELP
ncbi:MAG: nicotinate phosphoribosyltransferase [Nitriliruptor sp.]|nr:MAG: nicotinate phosphoribosyltransferase [Nitriliruptor sp.]TVR17309.1 MAG: nicotinate phosphoribosyltransferase [Nitriliruptor sp.]